jgi:hypothetical protein
MLDNSVKRETHKALRCCQGLALSYGTIDIKGTRSFFFEIAIDKLYTSGSVQQVCYEF